MTDHTNGNSYGFDIRSDRAMVSLGPLSPKQYCTYKCAFCYVQADFSRYPSLPVEKILEFLGEKSGSYDIVYVSGDTDSLAPPRTDKGIELIAALATLGTDVLFTTRAPLSEGDLDRLAAISRTLANGGRLLFGCISISRLRSAPYLEPHPVPSPERRLEVLKGLKQRGIVSVLAMRPFLPVIPVSEYLDLARLATPFVDAILGEDWYVDKHGILERRVWGDQTPPSLDYEEHRMDFDSNNAVWNVWKGVDIQQAVAAYCVDSGIPFFMRSRPAILCLRKIRFPKTHEEPR